MSEGMLGRVDLARFCAAGELRVQHHAKLAFFLGAQPAVVNANCAVIAVNQFFILLS